MDGIFRALSDPTRRRLLDLLFAEDGLTLRALCEELPELSRFGVMKHLRVLEEADLVISRKVGRERHHYLNPVPIRLVHDRWISKFSEPWARTLSGLKHDLEGGTMATQAAPQHIQSVTIRTTPERLWQALVDPAFTERYYFGTRVESSLVPGAPFRYMQPDGDVMIDGVVVECVPPRRLVTTFEPKWKPLDADLSTRVTFEIEQRGDDCVLTLTHDGFSGESELYTGVGEGWVQILDGLKQVLEAA